VTNPISQEKKYKGLYIRTMIKDAESKARADARLSNWAQGEFTAEDWVKRLSEGDSINVGEFERDTDGKFHHKNELWQGTYFVMADADNFRGTKDASPNALEPFTETTGLSRVYPTLPNKVFAVSQSVNSMIDMEQEVVDGDPPLPAIPGHRRYRLTFLFDEMITSVVDYKTVLGNLAKEFPIISTVKRGPAQPVFGNANPDTRMVHIKGNILKLSEYLNGDSQQQSIPEPQEFKVQPSITNLYLPDYLRNHKIPFTEKSQYPNVYYIECPYKKNHTGGKQNDTATYVFTNESGKFAFYCHHAHCSDKRNWEDFKKGFGIKSYESKEMSPLTRMNYNLEKIREFIIDNPDDRFEIIPEQYSTDSKVVLVVKGEGRKFKTNFTKYLIYKFKFPPQSEWPKEWTHTEKSRWRTLNNVAKKYIGERLSHTRQNEDDFDSYVHKENTTNA